MAPPGRLPLVATPKSLLRRYEREMLAEDWRTIHDGIEVKILDVPPVPGDAPQGDGSEKTIHREIFLLCRRCDRVQKGAGILQRFEERIEKRLTAMAERCVKQKRNVGAVERDLGRLLGQNTRADCLFEVRVTK